MSKQSGWQARKLALGLCRQCGKRPLRTKTRCITCGVQQAAYDRKRRGPSSRLTSASEGK